MNQSKGARGWMSKELLLQTFLFIILAVLTLTTVVYARRAEVHSKEVSTQLNKLTLTAQNRCIIKVILSYPPPVGNDQFNAVLAGYDTCIQDEINKASGKEINLGVGK